MSSVLGAGLDHRWRFGIVSILGALLWVVGQAYGLGSSSSLDAVLCRQLAAAGAWSLRLVGFAADTDAVQPQLLLLNQRPTVIVGGPCDGLVLYALLVGFVLAYPGSNRRRLWFIPLGIGVLWLLNVVRIGALALNHAYYPATLDFNHHYVFSAVAYTVLAVLWTIWVRPSRSQSGHADTRAPGINSFVSFRSGHMVTIILGGVVLMGLILANAYQDAVVATLAQGWSWLSARLVGAAIPSLPAGVTRLPLAVGAAFAGLYLLGSVLCLRLLLPTKAARLVYRSYAGAVFTYAFLLVIARFSSFSAAYPAARLLLDFLISPLPVAALLILLWQSATIPATTRPAAAPLAG